MGGISHLFDSNKSSTSHSKSGHKKYGDGFEAPRNSLELANESSKGYIVIQEIPVKQHGSSKAHYCINRSSMKKLIDEEISEQTYERRSTPGVVARLMGMEPLSETSSRTNAKENEVEKLRKMLSRSEHMESSSGQEKLPRATYSRQTKEKLVPNAKKQDSRSHKMRRPQLRKHPQEELLQKFKEDFEAWQTSNLQRQQGLQGNYSLREGKDYQALAQENLNKEKMTKYLATNRNLSDRKPVESKKVVPIPKLHMEIQQRGHPQCRDQVSLQSYATTKTDMKSKNGGKINDLECFASNNTDKGHERSCSPTKIVILKPNFERCDVDQEPFSGTLDVLGKECSMEQFLQEVKERLKSEIHGKKVSHTNDVWSTTENPFDEKPTDPKQIARNIARRIRENVSKDIGVTLLRSDSTKSYVSEIQVDEPVSPDIIRRDTRKLMSKRLKNILRNEVDSNEPVVNDDTFVGTSILSKDKGRPKPMTDLSSKDGNVKYWEVKKSLSESMSSHRQQNSASVATDAETVSPNLIRSFSAPAPGTVFGKLLQEDQHILTGAQIRRKHEAELVSKKMKNNSTLRGKVSNLKRSFIFKGKLFGKKSQLMTELAANDFPALKPTPSLSSAAAITSAIITQENATEVPPSPASVASSSQDDFCRPDNPSPVSPLEVPAIEYHHPLSQETGELSSNILEQVDHSGYQMKTEGLPIDVAAEEHPCKHEEDKVENIHEAEHPYKHEEDEVEDIHEAEHPCKHEEIEVENIHEVYLRDIFATVGLYQDTSPDQASSKWDALTRPISNQVFEEDEDAYLKYEKLEDDEDPLIDDDDTTLGRKLLFDMVNEALQNVLGPKINCSMFRGWVQGSAAVPKKGMLDDLWNQIQLVLNPPRDALYNIDGMVARDVKMTTMPCMLYEDMDTIGRQMERVILRSLIDDFVRDICSQKPV